MEVMAFYTSYAFSQSVGKTLITARIFVSFYMSVVFSSAIHSWQSYNREKQLRERRWWILRLRYSNE